MANIPKSIHDGAGLSGSPTVDVLFTVPAATTYVVTFISVHNKHATVVKTLNSLRKDVGGVETPLRENVILSAGQTITFGGATITFETTDKLEAVGDTDIVIQVSGLEVT